MTFDPEDMYQIVSTIWDAAIGLQVTREAVCPAEVSLRSTAACIQITGAWNGAVLLDCPEETARITAAIMFNSTPEAVSVADQQEAVAELVNMIGGNFKALLKQTCYLSLPAVVEGGDYSTRIPGSSAIGRLVFSCQGQPVSVTVMEKRILK